MIPLNAAALSKATGAPLATAEKFLPFIQGTCKAYGITTPKTLAGFLSQIGHESGGMQTLEESLNYSVDGLLSTFRRHRISEADARRYGRAPGRPANQQAIANCVYGGAWGRENLGNMQAGDGWRYRGRGLKQLTGLFNYRACSDALMEDFVSQPDRLLMPVNAALSAGWFWHKNNLNAIAERGDVVKMTRIINGGENGLKERTALFNEAVVAFA